jgi:hypothetical protein
MQWNKNELSQQFLSAAQNAEMYLAEITPKAKDNSAHRNVYDEHLAKFFCIQLSPRPNIPQFS